MRPGVGGRQGIPVIKTDGVSPGQGCAPSPTKTPPGQGSVSPPEDLGGGGASLSVELSLGRPGTGDTESGLCPGPLPSQAKAS